MTTAHGTSGRRRSYDRERRFDEATLAFEAFGRHVRLSRQESAHAEGRSGSQ